MVKVRTVGNLSTSTTPTVEELKRSVERLQALMDEIPAGILNVDLKGKITYVNKRFEEVSGYSWEEMLGKNGLKLGMFSSETVKLLGKRMKDRLMGRPPLLLEMQFKCKDGHWIWVALEGKLMRERGIPVGFQIISTDITERKLVEEALQAEKNKLQSVIDALEYGLTIQDTDYNIIYQNEPLRIIFGDRVGEKCYRVYESRDKLCDGCPVEKAFRDGKSHTSERRVIIPSGEVTFWENTANPIRDAMGRIVSCLEITRNITERKRAEEALLESEERFRSIVENSHDGIMILDDAYRFIYVNDELCRMSGYPREEIIGQDFRNFLDEESKQLVADRYIRRQRGEEVPPRYEFNIVRKDGQKRRVEISSCVIKDSAGRVKTVAQILDITERKRIEEALKLQKAYFQQLFDNSPDAIAWLDEADRFVTVNKGFETLFGYRAEEAKGRFINDIVVPEDRFEEAVALSQAALNGKVRRKETVRKRKDGSLVDVSALGYPIQFGSKRVGVFAVYTDITERKQAEEALKRQKAYFQQLFDDSPDAIAMWDDSGRVVNINKGFETLFGYRAEEVKGRPINNIVIPEDRLEEASTLSRAVLSNEAQRIETVRKRKDGSLVDVSLLHFPIRFGNKTVGVYTIYTDITERKRMEREIQEKNGQLIRSERLAAIGQLAGGVGHELRNPLSAIKNAVYYIKGKVASSELGQREPRVMEFLDIIDDEINSSNKIITDLLGFSRVGKPSVSPARIERIIEDALSHTPIPQNIELTKKLDAGLPEINIDPDQIRQVVVNIITNAVEAMPEGGRLLIAAREKDKFLEVEVSDTGCGIPQESMDKIFDPLFTTKAKGIGLGLAMCKAIIDRHEGNITVKSKVGEGTTFSLRLPLGRNIGGN